MSIPTLGKWFAAKRSATERCKDRSNVRIGIPKVLNIWSTHQFWLGFLTALGIQPSNIVFSSDTSEEQYREFGKGRGTVDCCHPVKCISGHYGQLIFGQRKKINILLSPMIYSLPSFLKGNVVDTLACPRVMAAPENIKAGFMKERNVFAENQIHYASPFVSLGEPDVVPKQLYGSLRNVLYLDKEETEDAVQAGYGALEVFNTKMREKGREILTQCARENRPCILVLGRPYHMDTGIGHEIEVGLQAYGYPVLWTQYFPIDEDLMEWLFGQEIRAGEIRSPFDISDVWLSSYSSNTNEILWGAKVGTRCPWIACVIHLSSYECGMDQPTYSPVQRIVEASGTLYFKFGDLDTTKPVGGVKMRSETIAYYMAKYSREVIAKKLAWLPERCPLVSNKIQMQDPIV
jgi:predicted nucleotide-binding protein (sugar kinase/HSP70/actin superfamily)